MVFRNFLRDNFFFCQTPRWALRVIYQVFGPVWAAGPGSEREKHDFPELGALLGKKYVYPKGFSPNLRNFFIFCVFTERTPTGGKSRNAGLLGSFGLGQPLGTWRNYGPKTEK